MVAYKFLAACILHATILLLSNSGALGYPFYTGRYSGEYIRRLEKQYYVTSNEDVASSTSNGALTHITKSYQSFRDHGQFNFIVKQLHIYNVRASIILPSKVYIYIPGVTSSFSVGFYANKFFSNREIVEAYDLTGYEKLETYLYNVNYEKRLKILAKFFTMVQNSVKSGYIPINFENCVYVTKNKEEVYSLFGYSCIVKWKKSNIPTYYNKANNFLIFYLKIMFKYAIFENIHDSDSALTKYNTRSQSEYLMESFNNYYIDSNSNQSKATLMNNVRILTTFFNNITDENGDYISTDNTFSVYAARKLRSKMINEAGKENYFVKLFDLYSDIIPQSLNDIVFSARTNTPIGYKLQIRNVQTVFNFTSDKKIFVDYRYGSKSLSDNIQNMYDVLSKYDMFMIPVLYLRRYKSHHRFEEILWNFVYPISNATEKIVLNIGRPLETLHSGFSITKKSVDMEYIKRKVNAFMKMVIILADLQRNDIIIEPHWYIPNGDEMMIYPLRCEIRSDHSNFHKSLSSMYRGLKYWVLDKDLAITQFSDVLESEL